MHVKSTYHVHDAELIQFEDWGDNRTLMRFKGLSCGHGYGINEATIIMNEAALMNLSDKLRGVKPDTDCIWRVRTCRYNVCATCGKALKPIQVDKLQEDENVSHEEQGQDQDPYN